jgi:CelD/BcsL family acetyltransferase involved in cellulose biosynthesis
MVSISNTATMDDVAPRPRVAWWRGPRFVVEVFDGADEALTALEAVQGGLRTEASLSSTGFQSLNWLTVVYEELAVSKRAMPRLVVVTERNTGEVALVLPLVIKKKRSLNIARFADLGVSDYGAPILGPALLVKRRSIRRAWRAVRHALRDVDMIRLERMPAEIAGRPNPLISRAGMAPSRLSGSTVRIGGTVDDYVAGLDAKDRDAIERGTRLWNKEDNPRFARATTADDVAHAYAVLEEQQAERNVVVGRKYKLNDLAFRQFYERLAIDATEVELGHLFTLEAGGDIIAALFGIQHDGTFTVLRASDAGKLWSDVLPSHLLIIKTMKYFVDQDVRTFDFGLGDHPFKRGLIAVEVPLYDLIVARDLAAVPRATFHRVKGRARKNQRLRRFFGRLTKPRQG